MLKLGLLFTLLASGIKTTDTHNGFRVLSRQAARDLRITLDRMAHASELLDLIALKKLRYLERPVTITYTPETLTKGHGSWWGSFKVVKDFLTKKFLG